MPDFLFVGDAPRVFPDLSLEVVPGQVISAEVNPDPVFFDVAEAPPVAVPDQSTAPTVTEETP